MPSKVFEYAASGKPIWAGVDGYAASFIKKNVENSVTFTPCNEKEAIESFSKLKLGDVSRKVFVSQFSRDKIVDEFCQDILKTFQDK